MTSPLDSLVQQLFYVVVPIAIVACVVGTVGGLAFRSFDTWATRRLRRTGQPSSPRT
ncbi:MAG: hypothetical protein H0X73_06585 [Chthoniobacterales bacterium]|nr:hypothetical protein [Chthoniobacterales bacterium]